MTLTFDNGPDETGTRYVMAALAERALRATFFVIAQRLDDRDNRSLVVECHEQGHWIGNHTLSHSRPLGCLPDAEYAAREIGEAERILGDLAHRDRLFRPHNEGILSRALLSRAAVDYLQSREFTLVLWNLVPQDWLDPEGWPERAFVSLGAHDHAVVVLHDTERSAMRHLPAFLDRLEQAGHSVVQDFPSECVPMRRGQLIGDLGGLVAS